MRTILLLCLLLAACEGAPSDFDGDGSPDLEDCDPEDASIYPGAPDEYGDGISTDCVSCPNYEPVDGVDLDCDTFPSNVPRDHPRYDCDDNDEDVNPDAEDPVGDGIDQDCSEVLGQWDCPDADGDEHCAGTEDCDDDNPDVHADAVEVTNCVDDDCDGQIDEDLATSDGDGDGWCVGEDLGMGPQCCGADLPGDCDDTDLLISPDDRDGDGEDTCGPDGLPGSGDEDCDDADPSNVPGGVEVCDGRDNDCDGSIPADELDADGDGLSTCAGDCDDTDATLSLADADGDGLPSCGGDCDDTDPALNLEDGDGDGASTCGGDCDDADASLTPADADGDGVSTCDGDCDDLDPTTYPGAPELCDGLDNDCDGSAAADNADGDGDGFAACDECDDTDPAVHPGAEEVCDDGQDNDCDSATPDVFDSDADGSDCDLDCDDDNPVIHPAATDLYGDGLDLNCDGIDGVDSDGDTFAGGLGPDCNDGDPTIHPGAFDPVDGVDQDCDGFDGVDLDGDTFFDEASGGSDCDDTDPDAFPGAPDTATDGVDQNCDDADGVDGDGDGAASLASLGDDCDDADPSRHPGAPELCDDIDSNCDGVVDDDIAPDWYPDGDRDGFGGPGLPIASCTQPATYVALDTDCDDADVNIHPGAPELCDAVDQDCDGDVSDELDGDGDGEEPCAGDCDDTDPAVHTHAIEIPADSFDQNCDGYDGCTDLNCDGWPDLVFGNATDGLTPLVDSYIYYGGPAGFSPSNKDTIPTQGTGDLRIADLDGDGFQDILFGHHDDGLENFPFDSWIYWGGPTGYSTADRTTLDTNGAAGLEIADLNDDGRLDIVVSNYHGAFSVEIDSYVYLGDGAGRFTTATRIDLPTLGAWGNTVADFDQDGFQDIVFANYRADPHFNVDSYIYWGSGGGWSVGDRDTIDTFTPYAVESGDLDGNGYPDLVFASYSDQNATDWSTTSIFWYFVTNPVGFSGFEVVDTLGASAVSLADFDNDGDLDAFIGHQRDHANDGERDSYIFWQDEAVSFDSAIKLALPTSHVVTSFAGDLDLDGFVDLVVANYRDNAFDFTVDSTIYWGSETGPDASDFTGLPTAGATGVRAVGGTIPVLRTTVP